MTIRLSKSAIETYQQCGLKYQFHYIDRYRSKLQDSPLFFGSALDEALNVFLLSKKKELTPEERETSEKDIVEVFVEKLTNVKILDDVVDIRFSELARYSNSDLDLSIFLPEDIQYVIVNNPVKEILPIKDMEELELFINECQLAKKEKKLVGASEYILFNLCNWVSLKRKGLMLIEEYRVNVMPEILEVHSIQEVVHLPSPTGDYIIGFIDFIATFKDGVMRVMDNKTSSQRYTQQNIVDSLQLSIYTEFKNIKDCGFAVLEKKIRKKEPRVRSELIFGQISDEQLDRHFVEIEKAFEGIKAGVFEENKNSCFAYGKPCSFYDICHNGDDSKLVKLGEKK